MIRTLPSGFATRSPAMDDARAILAVGAARDVADVGQPDWTLADVRTNMIRPGVDLERDWVLVTGARGEVVAFAFVKGVDAVATVHPETEGRGIGSFLCEQVEQRARAAGSQVVRQEVMTANARAVELLEGAGYEREERYWRMTRDLDGSESAAWPPAARRRSFQRGRDERPAYELVSGAMADVPGHTEQPFEEWSARTVGESLAPELSVLAEDGDGGGALAGVALCQRWDGGDGYVDYLAVARDWRGRGLGRALLQESLRRFAENGMRRGVLWVNGRNESATRLYRSAGMDVQFSADRYVKRLAPR